jgi:hypothetical protein
MVMKTTLKKAVEANDYKLLTMAYPDLDKEISFEEFKKGKILASLRAYDLAFTDGAVRQVLVPFLEFGAINFAGLANVKCLQIDSHMKLRAQRDILRGEVIV